jgi:hypothetical protein
MSDPAHLLDQALALATRGQRPRNVDLKRAISTVYYAIFHELAKRCSDTLIGPRYRETAAWARVYRSLEHGKLRQEFKRLSAQTRNNQSDAIIGELAIVFVELQEYRHFADYDPGQSQLSRIGVIAMIKRTDAVIEAMSLLSKERLLDLCSTLVIRDRKSS